MKNIEVEIPKDVQKYFPTEWNGLRVYFNGVQLCVEGYENSEEFKALKLHNSIIALGIKEIGPATAERLNKCGLDLKQLLSLNPDRLRSILIANGEFKDGRELEVLIKNLFALTKVELWQVIYAMQFENCGKTISKQLANWMVSVDYDFKGLEKKVVENFINYTTVQDEVKELVGILLDNNVEVIKPKKISSDIITFEMSGSAGSFGTKEDYVRLVQQSGKCMHTSLSKTTNYLIVESLAQNTTKMQKAQKNGTQVIEYQQFYDYIKSL
jgi:NAD-dependent DNA ligase